MWKTIRFVTTSENWPSMNPSRDRRLRGVATVMLLRRVPAFSTVSSVTTMSLRINKQWWSYPRERFTFRAERFLACWRMGLWRRWATILSRCSECASGEKMQSLLKQEGKSRSSGAFVRVYAQGLSSSVHWRDALGHWMNMEVSKRQNWE